MQTVSLVDIVPSPWKNQRGTTQEMLTWPKPENWRVRLSVATIDQSGEFSRFEGVVRWFTVIDGEGVDLEIGEGDASFNASTGANASANARTSVDVNSDPLCFSGDASCSATLHRGTVHAFNAMFASGFEGRVARVCAEQSIRLGSAEFVGVYGVDPTTFQMGQEVVSIKAGDLCWIAKVMDVAGSLSGGLPSQLLVRQGHGLVVLGQASS